LLGNVEPHFTDLLAQVEYAPVAQVAAGYRLSQISRFRTSPPRGFGFLVPRTEGLRLLGTVWNSFLFAGRAPDTPEKMALFTSFAGGATDPEIFRLAESEIAALVHKELAGVLGISGEPVVQHVARWERALPQYNLGHPRVVTALGEFCAASPGIFLTGNYLAGPSMGACVEHANKTAGAAAQFLRAQP
jgi:oxygen-dependent protoporphyrinogen oxidase